MCVLPRKPASEDVRDKGSIANQPLTSGTGSRTLEEEEAIDDNEVKM